jgi:two-component system, sensor histidine kinase ChiS
MVIAGEPFDFNLITSEKKAIKKGLSQNTIYSVLQDRYGYMWFGTWDGLNKYDGYSFTIYNKENGLSNEVIYALLETIDGTLWIGTENGMNALNRKTGKITIYQTDPADSLSLSDNWINHIYQAGENKLFVCTRKGLNILDTKTGKIQRHTSRDAGNRRTRSNNINQIAGHNGFYYVATDFGLIKYNPKTNENVRYLNRPDDHLSLSNNKVSCIFSSKEGRIWAGTENGLNLLDEHTGKFKRYHHDPNNPSSISHNKITTIFQDDAGLLWVGTDGGGLSIFDPEKNAFRQIQNQPADTRSLNNNRIYSITQDKTGNIWIGTFKGVNRIDRFSRRFELFTYNTNNKNSIGNNLIWSFCEIEPDLFWIGTDDGISIFDRKSNHFSHPQFGKSAKNTLSSKRIRHIIKDQQGSIWIGTRDAGLNRYDPNSGEIVQYRPSIQHHHSLGDDFVISLFEDREGFIWAGTFNGLNRIDPKTGNIRLYQHQPEDTASLSNNTIYHITEDRSGAIWLATYNGLNRYNSHSDNFTVYRHQTGISEGFSANRLFYVQESKDGFLWIGSRGGGILKFDPAQGAFLESYTTANGLPNNVVYGILEDEHGNFWMSTNWGLSIFDRKTKTFINYDVTDGLQSNEFNAMALLKCSGGQMFFGGMNGFNMFHPDEIERNPNVPNIVISSFKKFNTPQSGEVYHGDTIILQPDENFFSFEFSSLDYTNPFKSQYTYILEGFTNSRTYVDGLRNFAEYTSVNPGVYTFCVTGSNSDGVWNNDGIALTIIIKPHWYQTWYFRAAIAIGVISLIWLLFYLRYRSVSKKQMINTKMLQIENQLLEFQQQALRLQMNPHFIFNSLNSIQSFILSKDIDLAVNYLSRFSQLMRMIMINSSESIISLADEILAITHYMEIEKLRFDDKFSYDIQVDDEIDEEFTGIPPMLIQPYIENSIIHGLIHKDTPGKIEIRFKKNDAGILCTILDNGIGREKSSEMQQQNGLNRKSRGMMISKERLDIFNKNDHNLFSVKVFDLQDSQGNPTGTKVELLISYHEM